MSKKEKKGKKECPVETGGDFRAVVRRAAAETRANEASAPDGVSGKWK
ncbi:MAG: hypothetical protein IJP64_00380 [Oscillospiraceae bacterium]|nr:hypothetical protein [Oscillospiraceae bacterium]